MRILSNYIKNFLLSSGRVLFVITAVVSFLIYSSENAFATTYTSGTGSQASTTTVVAGVNDQEIIKVTLVAGGGGAALFRCRMDFTMQNTDNADISNAKLYYTGTTNSFSTTTLLATVVNPTGTISFTFSHSTGAGTFYYWLAYDIKSTAPNCNVFDAQVAAIYAGASCPGTSQTVTTPNPAGDRTIEAPGCWKYCIPTGNLNCTVNDYISQIKINTLNNFTVCNAGGYTNFAATGSQTTELTRGATYTISMGVGAGTGTHGGAVWIDFNNNGVFTDGGEYFLISNAITPNTIASIPITVPAGAVLGSTRMRIRYAYALTVTNTMSCTMAGTYGETEDYTVNLTDNMVYASSLVTQTNTAGVSAGTTSQEIICIKISTVGTANVLNASTFSLNTSGTDNPLTNIQNAKLIYTGSTSTFATSPQVGSTVAVPNGNFTFSFSQPLLTGDNYFWLIYDVQAGAVTGDVIDAIVNTIALSSGTYVPSSYNPSGNRPIGPMTFVSSSVEQITAPIGISTSNNQILRIKIITKGALSPLSATSFSINANGTSVTVTNKVQNGKIFYTGTSEYFNTTTQFGSTVAAISATTVAVTGSTTLAVGTNYFWFAMDVKATAAIGDFIDGECTSVTVGGTPYSPATPAPASYRTVCVAWTGGTNTDWRTATNWSSGAIPLSTTDVVITPVATQPTIDGPSYSTNQNGDCRNIYIMPGATLTIKAMSTSPSPMGGNEKGKLVVNGNFINDGTIQIIHFTLGMPLPGDYILPMYFEGSGTIGGNGSILPEVGFEGFYNGYFLINDNAIYSLANDFPKSGEVLFDMRVGGSGTGAVFNMGSYSLRTNGITVMTGNTYNQNTGKLMFEGQKTISPTTNPTNPYGVFTGGTINLGTTGVYFTKDVITDNYQRHIITLSVPYKNIFVETEALTDGSTGTLICDNLELTNSGSAENTLLLWNTSTVTVNQNLTIRSNCKIKPSVSTDQTLNLYGNFLNHGIFQGRSDDNVRKITKNFIGTSSPQSISGLGTTTFSNLTIFNTSTGVTLNQPVTVLDILTLTDGNLFTTSTNLLTMNAGSSVSGGSVNSFVDGPIKKIGNDAFIFPTGNGTRWARLGITAPTNVTTEYTAQYFAHDPTTDGYGSTSLAAGPPTLNNVSVKEYWTLDQAVNNDDVQVKLYWEDNSFSRILDCDGTPDDLRLAHWNGSAWEINVDGVVLTGTCSGGTPGTMQSNAVQPTYSPITFGSKTGINPLPVKLINFTSLCNNGFIQCKWATASETNNDYFILERSYDAEKWEHVAQIKGAGNSNEIKNYEYFDKLETPALSLSKGQTIYYRLIQRDFDGKETIFNTIAANCELKDDFYNIIIYPNPAKEEINLLVSSAIPDEGKIYIYNNFGICVYCNNISIGNETSKIKIDLAKFSVGSYYIKCVFDKHNPSEYKFVHLDK